MFARTRHLKKGEKDLLWAAANGDADLVSMLLDDQGADVKACDSLRMTALHFACRHGHHAIARTLLAHGADANAEDDKGVCPLHFAAYHGHLGCVEALCEAGANLRVQEGSRSNGATALYRAAGQGCIDVVQMLLQHGAPVDGDPSFPLHAAVAEGHTSIVLLLLDAGGRMEGAHGGEREGERFVWLICL